MASCVTTNVVDNLTVLNKVIDSNPTKTTPYHHREGFTSGGVCALSWVGISQLFFFFWESTAYKFFRSRLFSFFAFLPILSHFFNGSSNMATQRDVYNPLLFEVAWEVANKGK